MAIICWHFTALCFSVWSEISGYSVCGMVFTVSMWVSSGLSDFLPLPRNPAGRWITDDKFPLGVNECECVCMVCYDRLVFHTGCISSYTQCFWDMKWIHFDCDRDKAVPEDDWRIILKGTIWSFWGYGCLVGTFSLNLLVQNDHVWRINSK